MYQRLFLCCALFLIVLRAGANNITLHFKEAGKLNRLMSVRIKCILANQSVVQGYSDSLGTFTLKNATFPVQLRCSLLGYSSFSKQINPSDLTTGAGGPEYTVLLERNVQNIQEVVVTGQAQPVLAKQSIYKVNTISAEQIAQRGAVNLGDVLGFEMNQLINNDNILGSSVSMGGLGGQNVKILVNGIPVAGRENGNIDLGQLNMNNIKRVEMIQGPMSVMYGSNALGGVINLITNTPTRKLNFNVRTYLESIGRYNFSGQGSWMKKNHQFQLSLARNFFQGWAPADSIDRFQLWKPKTQYTADLMYNYARNRFKFSYFGSYLNEKISNRGAPIINPYEGYAFDEIYRTHRQIHALSFHLKLSEKEQLQLVNSYSPYRRTKNRYKKDLVSLQQFETPGIGDQDTSIFRQINARGSITSNRLKNLEALAGYEINHETGISNKLADQTQRISDLGIFLSLNYRIKTWNIQPSVRYTLNSQFGNSWNPAFHTKWNISDRTQFRASYARGFRAPSLKEMYLQFIDQNHTILGNPELLPEHGDHAEAGIDYRHALGKSQVQFAFTSSYNRVKNLITLAVYNNHGVLRQYRNIDQYENWIQNLQIKWSRDQWSLQSGLAYTWVSASESVPQHTLFETGMQASYIWKKAGIGFNLNYKFNNKQPVLTLDNEFLYSNAIHSANFSVQRQFFKKHLNLQAGVKNLFNQQNAALNGVSTSGGNPHSNASSITLFPARSIFFDLIYNLK